MTLSWHSGIKKIFYVLLMALGGYLSLKYPDIFANFDFNNLGTLLLSSLDSAVIVGGATALAVESKKDTAAAAQRVSDYATKTDVQNVLIEREPSFDAWLYHTTVIMPAAQKDKVNNLRDTLAIAAYYVSQVIIKPDTPAKLAYVLGLAKGAFHSFVGMTWEQVIDKLPEFAAQCKGSTLKAVMLNHGFRWYAIYCDVQGLYDRYWQLDPSARPDIFEPGYTAAELTRSPTGT